MEKIEQPKVYSYRQYPSVIKELGKIAKKKGLTVSAIIRYLQVQLVETEKEHEKN